MRRKSLSVNVSCTCARASQVRNGRAAQHPPGAPDARLEGMRSGAFRDAGQDREDQAGRRVLGGIRDLRAGRQNRRAGEDLRSPALEDHRARREEAYPWEDHEGRPGEEARPYAVPEDLPYEVHRGVPEVQGVREVRPYEDRDQEGPPCVVAPGEEDHASGQEHRVRCLNVER